MMENAILSISFKQPLRQNGEVNSVAVLSAIGVDRKGNWCILGLLVAQSEAEIDWKEFLKSLVKRGLGVSNTSFPMITQDSMPLAWLYSRVPNGNVASFTSLRMQRIKPRTKRLKKLSLTISEQSTAPITSNKPKRL